MEGQAPSIKTPQEMALEGFERIWNTIDPRKKTQELRDDFNSSYCYIRDAKLPEQDTPELAELPDPEPDAAPGENVPVEDKKPQTETGAPEPEEAAAL